MLLYNVRNKFAFFVSIGCYVLLISRVLTETLQNFSSFCHFSFEGGGEWGGGSKRKLRELIMFFFIRHRLFDVVPNPNLFRRIHLARIKTPN